MPKVPRDEISIYYKSSPATVRILILQNQNLTKTQSLEAKHMSKIACYITSPGPGTQDPGLHRTLRRRLAAAKADLDARNNDSFTALIRCGASDWRQNNISVEMPSL